MALLVSSARCAGPPATPGDDPAIDAIDAELSALSRGLTASHPETFRAVLESTLANDSYLCRPRPREVFFGSAPEGARTIAGEMPHYGFFFGPMHYRVRRLSPDPERVDPERVDPERIERAAVGRWQVTVNIGVEPPAAEALELPDCDLVRALGIGSCRGVPYARAGGTSPCPASGAFSMPATPSAVRALLARWSREAEQYYNRDAAFFGLPIDYDFTFDVVDEGAAASGAAAALRYDLTVPLAPTCGRTPYFSAFRSGWSLPIVAHEVGHVLGLLDEYEALSGIASFYPKTPFPGAEVSRMGLSMREETRVLPLHHYLVLRRYFCPGPRGPGFFSGSGLSGAPR